MVLLPGKTEAGHSHRWLDQWLYVVSGTGEAIINSKTYPVMTGTLILIDPPIVMRFTIWEPAL